MRRLVPENPARLLRQDQRALAALTYLGWFLLLSYLTSGDVIPPSDARGLWFASAATAILLGEFLLEVFFTKPVDAIVNGTALYLGLAAASLDRVTIAPGLAQSGLGLFRAYGLLLVLVGLSAIFLKDRASPSASNAGRLMYELSGTIGRASLVFSLLYFAAVWATSSTSPEGVALLFLGWVVVFSLRPAERLLIALASRATPPASVASVESVEDPGLVVAKLPAGERVRLGTIARLSGQAGTGTVVSVTKLLGEQ